MRVIVLFVFTLSACSEIYWESPPSSSYYDGNSTAASELDEDQKRVEETDLLKPPSLLKLATEEEAPPEPEEISEQIEQAATNWFYGRGLGRTMINVGTIALFPPYAFYVLGNAGIELAGYEPLYVTNLLPEEPREKWNEVYYHVTSVPGRINSAVAGREFD